MKDLLKFAITIMMIFSISVASIIKLPSVDGLFYPKNSFVLKNTIDSYLKNASPKKIDGHIQAIIVPHAGYKYSGQIAAEAFKAASQFKYDTIILIGPSHYTYNNRISVYTQGSFQTPLGQIPINEDLAKQLANSNSDIGFYPDAFKKEHSLEVELPFIQRLFPEATIVPILFESQNLEHAQILAINLSKHLTNKTLIVISTDLSHYHDYTTAKQMEKLTLDLIVKNDITKLWENTRLKQAEACGLSGVITMMYIKSLLNLNEAIVLKTANSGDVTGDKSKVVGYAAFAYTTNASTNLNKSNNVKTDPSTSIGMRNTSTGVTFTSSNTNQDKYTKAEKAMMLKIARESINENLSNKKAKTSATHQIPKNLKETRGVFVTLKDKNHRLRGCIGIVIGQLPLHEGIKKIAKASAFNDYRFKPVTDKEIDSLSIEISILTPPKRISSTNEIIVGKHGLILQKGPNQGLLLPQVPIEWNWNKLEFLEALSRKAGLNKNAWKEGATIFTFEAIVFGEKN